jgi:aspartyl/asparaginyl beta-hydroxylase (cupin superfamily)
MFSAITPGTHIIPHNGPTNKKLRVHLGIMGCEGASIRVGEETRVWQDGKVLIFDDSFEHEVTHEGRRARALLRLGRPSALPPCFFDNSAAFQARPTFCIIH